MESKGGKRLEDLVARDMWDLSFEGENNCLGFMELLGMEDLGPSSSVFDDDDDDDDDDDESHHVVLIQAAAPPPPPLMEISQVVESEVFNHHQPTTPNSSSISSESTGAIQQQQHKFNNQLKPKKMSQKNKQSREPRFAFVTKSEVDHLEDGFRWRKYGQKAVKNSPFPRSYYKCTTAKCNVKKRVERSFNEPTIVVTTYEGKHTHPSPVMLRPDSGAGLRPGSGFSSNIVAPAFAPAMPHHHHHQPQLFKNQYLSSVPFMNINSCGNYISSANPIAYDHDQMSTTFGTPKSDFLKDNGLLQDMVPSFSEKEE